MIDIIQNLCILIIAIKLKDKYRFFIHFNEYILENNFSP
jgi:hypothetical protein